MEGLLSEGWLPLILSILAMAFGGLLKGATGAGVPILAVPVIALYYDVRTAVLVMILPSLLANVLQAWRYRVHLPEAGFAWRFALAGVVGAVIGTFLLATVAPRVLLLTVAGLVLVYVSFRLFKPGWQLPRRVAVLAGAPAGLTAGMLQGATGISAPISLTFLNACRLPRPVFVATVSLYFVASTSSQVVALAAYGFLTLNGMILSAAALALTLLMMPVGEAIARRISPAHFDKLILVMLTGIALRIVFGN